MSVSCHFCGQQWTRHPALEVECPKCSADVGLGCRRPSGHTGPFIEPHEEREQLAVDRRILGMCSEGPTARKQRSQPTLPDADSFIGGAA